MSEATEEPTTPPPGGPMPMIAALVALLIGAGAGYVVLAPKLAGGAPAGAEADAEAVDSHGNPIGVKTHFFNLSNVIVNPAGSQGSRFIVVTVAFEVPDEKVQLLLANAETQLRDAVTGVLERKSIDELLRPGARDAIRAEFEAVAKPYAKGATVRVFIPQFLIQ